MGFAHPMPPEAGSESGRMWYNLAQEFVKRGHEVQVIARRWPGYPSRETREGIQIQRLSGFDMSRKTGRFTLRDLRWSLRVRKVLPPSNVTVVNCATLPILPGWQAQRNGALIAVAGQANQRLLSLYRQVDGLLAVNTQVAQEALKANRRLASRVQVIGQPINWKLLSRPRIGQEPEDPVTIGFGGRLHREKGLDLFCAAIKHLARRSLEQPWRVVLSGVKDVALGGGGETYVMRIQREITKAVGPDRICIRPPANNEHKLAALYYEMDLFCYPSLMGNRETFALPVAEAMASGAIPFASPLPCLSDYMEGGYSGEFFDIHRPDAAESLARLLETYLRDPLKRQRVAENAQLSVYRYDFQLFASRLLADFATLAMPIGLTRP